MKESGWKGNYKRLGEYKIEFGIKNQMNIRY